MLDEIYLAQEDVRINLQKTALVVMTVMLSIISISFANAQGVSSNQVVVSPESKLYGMTYGEWSAKWWQWAESIPKASSPFTDTTGKNCAVNQNGPVWFLAGTSGGSYERSCTVPAGKGIFAGLLNNECSYAENKNLKTEPELRACALAGDDGVTSLTASIDGVPVANLTKFRAQSPLFSLFFPAGNGAGVQQGTTQSVSDGFWIFLHPLAPGTHELVTGGAVENPTSGGGPPNNFANQVTWHLTVR